jgi:cell shape-determining protein MreD
VANNNKRPAKPVKPAPESASRWQRVLWAMVGSILGVGIIAIAALLIGEAVTPLAISDATGIWAVVALVPNIALPLGFVLMIVLLVLTFVKRSRSAEGAGK